MATRGDRKGTLSRRKKSRNNSIISGQRRDWSRAEVANIRERNTEAHNNIMKELNVIKRRVDKVITNFQDFCEREEFSHDIDSDYIDLLLERYDQTQREREMILQSLKTFFKKQMFYLRDIAVLTQSDSQPDLFIKELPVEEEIDYSFQEAWHLTISHFDRLNHINKQIIALGKQLQKIHKASKSEPELIGKEQLDHLRDVYTKEAIQNLRMQRQLKQMSQEVQELRKENEALLNNKPDTRNLTSFIATAEAEIQQLRDEIREARERERVLVEANEEKQKEEKKKKGETAKNDEVLIEENEKMELPLIPSTPSYDYLTSSSIKSLNKRLYSRSESQTGVKTVTPSFTSHRRGSLLKTMTTLDEKAEDVPPPPPPSREEIVSSKPQLAKLPPKPRKPVMSPAVQRTLISQQKIVEKRRQDWRVPVKTPVQTVQLYSQPPQVIPSPHTALSLTTNSPLNDISKESEADKKRDGYYKPLPRLRYLSISSNRMKPLVESMEISGQSISNGVFSSHEIINTQNGHFISPLCYSMQATANSSQEDDSIDYTTTNLLPIKTSTLIPAKSINENDDHVSFPVLRKQPLRSFENKSSNDKTSLGVHGWLANINDDLSCSSCSHNNEEVKLPLMPHSSPLLVRPQVSNGIYVHSPARDPSVSAGVSKNRRAKRISVYSIDFPQKEHGTDDDVNDKQYYRYF